MVDSKFHSVLFLFFGGDPDSRSGAAERNGTTTFPTWSLMDQRLLLTGSELLVLLRPRETMMPTASFGRYVCLGLCDCWPQRPVISKIGARLFIMDTRITPEAAEPFWSTKSSLQSATSFHSNTSTLQKVEISPPSLFSPALSCRSCRWGKDGGAGGERERENPPKKMTPV